MLGTWPPKNRYASHNRIKHQAKQRQKRGTMERQGLFKGEGRGTLVRTIKGRADNEAGDSREEGNKSTAPFQVCSLDGVKVGFLFQFKIKLRSKIKYDYWHYFFWWGRLI